MEYSLKLVTAPIEEPVSIDEVKKYVHIDHDVEDTLISTWISSARRLAEVYQRRAYCQQTWEMSFDYLPSSSLPISLPYPPLIEVISVDYYDYQDKKISANLSDFIIDTRSEPARIALAYCKYWPTDILRSLGAMIIRYSAGYKISYLGSSTTPTPEENLIPAYVRDAICLYCAYRNENRSGEIDKIPQAFYDILNPERIFE